MNRQYPIKDKSNQYEITIPRSCITKKLEISTSKHEEQKIWQFRNAEYNKHYTEFSCNDDDNFDADAIILYSKNQQGNVVSTGRIVFDSLQGLPADAIIKNEVDRLRGQGLILAELSKLAISEEARGMLSSYIESFYQVSLQKNVDSLIFICKSKSAVIYKRLVGAKILIKNIQYSYGTSFTFSLLEWRIKESKYHQDQKSLEVVV